MSVPLRLALGVVLVAWGLVDYCFPRAVLAVQSDLLNAPPEPEAALARHKRRVGLVCILAGLVAVSIAMG
ncbi:MULTISPECIES: hypothetical protein [Halorussus]|uniref:hypothetical protein n=1 Tax=Halorussus TaxID=1070314 RepID=UPI000E214018|nr:MULTISPECIES: hypothetical protein [Halorussus]NHN58099.1 hypothetical protein [Halorussus sp. JP-T4]